MTESSDAVRPAIILDCDPGHDDAVAIVLAAHATDLRGIVTVSGNASLASTTHNALIMRDLLGIDVPVHAGSARPLLLPARHADYVHGESGLDGADLPEPTTPLDSERGVEFIVDSCRAEEGLWLVPVGPLTNIALALKIAPDLIHRIAGVSLMGGGRFGNRTAAAEFNLWEDPEAAAIVFEAFEAPGSARLVMTGLHVSHQLQVTPRRIEQTRALPGRLASTLADLFEFFSGTYLHNHDDGALEGAPLHDPLAVLAITNPELFTSVERHVAIETRGELTAGMTVIDERTIASRAEPNCEVLQSVDADAAYAIILDAIAALS